MEAGTGTTSEDGEVEVLQDPSEYARAFHKEKGARWVRGLTPVEAGMQQQKQQREQEGRWGWMGAASEESLFQDNMKYWKGPWLSVPILFGVLYFATLIGIGVFEGAGDGVIDFKWHSLDYPVDEEDILLYAIKQREDGFMDYIYRVKHLWVAPFIAALFSLTLSWSIGTAARHFLALCGVGLSLLSLMATIGQFVLLSKACDMSPISGKEECSIAFVLYWTLSLTRMGFPLFAVWCVSPVLDVVRKSGILWRFLLALPVLFFISDVALALQWVSAPTDRNNGKFHQWYVCVLFGAWGPLLLSCVRQRRFRVVFVPKQHQD